MKRSLRKIGGAAALTVSAATVLAVAPVSPASAAPGSCYGGFSNNRNAYYVCNNGGGEHRAIVYCKNTTIWGGQTRMGPWRTNGQQSWVSCPWGTVITQLYYGVR